MTDNDTGKKEGFREGIRQGMGVLSAFKEAIEETISEARDRGDLSAEKARQVMRDALDRAQERAGQARDRFDFATQGELDVLRQRVTDLAARVADLDGKQEPEPPRDAAEEAGHDGVGEETAGPSASTDGGTGDSGPSGETRG